MKLDNEKQILKNWEGFMTTCNHDAVKLNGELFHKCIICFHNILSYTLHNEGQILLAKISIFFCCVCRKFIKIIEFRIHQDVVHLQELSLAV